MTQYEIQHGDHYKFDRLANQTYKKVYNLAYRLTSSKSDAEDLTQEAFFRAFRGFDDYEGDKPFENWIFRILTRLFLDMLRSKRRHVHCVSYDAPMKSDYGDSSIRFEIPDNTFGPEDLIMHNILSEKLQQSMLRLKDSQRFLVFLADIDELSYHDIAEILGIPVGTVRSRLHRAHKQLRAYLE